MKKSLFVLALLCFPFLSAVAQPGMWADRSPAESAEMAVKNMSLQLGTLSAGQEASLTEIYTRFFEEMQAMRGQAGMEDRQQLDEQLAGVLNEEQLAAWQEVQQEQINRTRERRKGKGRGKPANGQGNGSNGASPR